MNNYFDEFKNDDNKNKNETALPTWCWALSIIGLIVCILWGYSTGMSVWTIAGEPIEDISDDTNLGILNFDGALLCYKDYLEEGYNYYDYPAYATYYLTDRPVNKYGGYANEYQGTAKFTASFFNMNYYDVSCVLTPEEGCENITLSFTPNIINGNMGARIVAVPKEMKFASSTEPFKVTHEVIARIDCDAETNRSFPASDEYCYILIVAAERAIGSYSFAITCE